MAEGRRRDAWDHTACLLTLLHNLHCTQARQRRSVEDFHPFHGGGGPAVRMTVAEYARILLGKR